MKLLFDQNISFRIIKKIEKHFPHSKQVRQLGLDDSPDMAIWRYAKTHEFTIVTFDADYYDISNFKGHPPKIIWLRMENKSTPELAEILIAREKYIKKFISSDEQSDIACLQIIEL